MTATHFSLFEFVGVEGMRVVKEEGLANVDYALVSGSITSGSPVVMVQEKRVPIAVNRLSRTTHLRWAGLLYQPMLLELSLACWYFAALFYDVIGWSSDCDKSYHQQ